METIQSVPHKVLGSQNTFSGKQSEIYSYVSNHIVTRLERIDSLQVRVKYNACIYKNHLIPVCRFILTVHELRNTKVDKLEAKCTKFLKSWVGLPCCTTPGVLHISPLIDIPTIHSLYIQSHATAHASFCIKADDKINTALDSKVECKEVWQRKFTK